MTKSNKCKILFFLSLLVFVTGCTLSSPAPVSGLHSKYKDQKRGTYRGSYYKVRKGDTLYYIAYITDRDVKDIIRINHLSKPYTIYPGQKIQLWHEKYRSPEYGTTGPVIAGSVATSAAATTVAKATTVAAASSATTVSSDKKYAPKKKSGSQSQNKKKVDSKKSKEYIQTNKKNNTDNNKSTNSSNPAKKVKVSTSKKISWSWPVSGKVIEKFSSTELGNKGVDIAGRRGSNIAASADGKVVYAGNALRGYGNLIIIKHNDDFLSAYAHNDRIFVREQQSVSKGQKIASMGSSGTNTVRLHFEIRYKGKSVDPLRYLPRR
ncbi:murein hydrolase activator NlpD [Veronia pacifica]|uniref:murein hydrolase activator NlpD n=1 Tax=Veronia pacifica TaxID=1080227 RepID=UPI0036373A3F